MSPRDKLRRFKEEYDTASRCRDDMFRRNRETSQVTQHMADLSWRMRRIQEELLK